MREDLARMFSIGYAGAQTNSELRTPVEYALLQRVLVEVLCPMACVTYTVGSTRQSINKLGIIGPFPTSVIWTYCLFPSWSSLCVLNIGSSLGLAL